MPPVPEQEPPAGGELAQLTDDGGRVGGNARRGRILAVDDRYVPDTGHVPLRDGPVDGRRIDVDLDEDGLAPQTLTQAFPLGVLARGVAGQQMDGVYAPRAGRWLAR